MRRYCFEVGYLGTAYAGFQTQRNANAVQDEVEKALQVLYKQPVALTGSSRTDAGVHARQNFFHADVAFNIQPSEIYNLNAILPPDIVLHHIYDVPDQFHCRFAALHRRYRYYLYNKKNPFVANVAWHFPYTLSLSQLNASAQYLMAYTDFSAFSKRNSQVHTKRCQIQVSHWFWQNGLLVYEVQANRFLRGMVRGLVATQLLVGRGKIGLDTLVKIVESQDPSKANFSAPAHGLFLEEVAYAPDAMQLIG
jgi:tRNA pseudouridine38-40 synthase